MRRAPHLAALACLVALAALACRPGPPPDLVLVSVDTLRADVLACYGGPRDVGRALCAPASAGTRFVWAFATAPYTVPSVASILSSRYPSGHAASQFAQAPMAESVVTVAETLSGAGYATAAFVSNPVLAAHRNLGQGFDVYDDTMTRRERNRPGYAERTAADTTDAALAWWRGAPSPRFLWVHYQDPHGPYEPPDAPAAADAAGVRRLRVLATNSGYGGIPAYQALPNAVGAETYRRRYLDEIRYLDDAFGRLLEVVDAGSPRPGLLLTADHGEALGEDGYWFAHGHSLGLDQIRVPLLWRPPGGGAARAETRPVSLLDVAPTLLDAAGIEAPAAFEGRPLDAPAEAGRAFFAEHPARSAAVVGQRYYARDLGDLRVTRRDPNAGGVLRPLPAREAPLVGDDPGLPAYEPGGGVSPLEPHLATFLRDHRLPAPEKLDPATEDRLRALGYLD